MTMTTLIIEPEEDIMTSTELTMERINHYANIRMRIIHSKLYNGKPYDINTFINEPNKVIGYLNSCTKTYKIKSLKFIIHVLGNSFDNPKTYEDALLE